jgi:hypothetical protein
VTGPAGLRAWTAAVLVAVASPAEARPSDGELVAAGAALAIPTYFLGVAVHEGAHAVAAELVGADTIELHLLPGRNPHNGAFQFGWTRVRGLQSRGERIFFLSAPKIVDAVLLGGYAAAWATDSLPDNSWGHLVVQVLATGFWVDFAKDVLVFGRHNDVVRVFNHLGLDNEWKRLPVRVIYAAASGAIAYAIWAGWVDLFERNDAEPAAAIAPLWSGAF